MQLKRLTNYKVNRTLFNEMYYKVGNFFNVTGPRASSIMNNNISERLGLTTELCISRAYDEADQS